MHKNVNPKHYCIVVVLFIISLCNVYAQQEKSSKYCSKKEYFAFGPKLSVNFTQNNPFPFVTNEFIPGADLGLFFRFKILRFYLQPEVSYVIRQNKMYCWNRWQSEPDCIEKFETNHISVPLLVGFSIIDFRLLKLRVFAGPELNFGLIKHSNDFQLGLQTGLGVDIWRFTIDAGYSFLSYTNGMRWHNNIFKVGVGFKCY